MSTESISSRCNAIADVQANRNLQVLLQSMLADIAAQKAAIAAVTAKLDADAGVTDTNYAATCNSAALKTKP
jgi:hypothetical protein